uniref:Transmembrane protein n=1 Tax=Bactrocera dorsalis TaxID=27457 RepID=A0A034WEJ8_BACDO
MSNCWRKKLSASSHFFLKRHADIAFLAHVTHTCCGRVSPFSILTSANVVIFCHSESSPNIEIICVQPTFVEMQMRQSCTLFVSILQQAAATTAAAFAPVYTLRPAGYVRRTEMTTNNKTHAQTKCRKVTATQRERGERTTDDGSCNWRHNFAKTVALLLGCSFALLQIYTHTMSGQGTNEARLWQLLAATLLRVYLTLLLIAKSRRLTR